jgi:uncharacterized repeat protein (TIGR03803 family)
LALGSDGNLYGTTAYGGANDGGTVFKMTSEGELATLVEFTGNGASNKGRIPFAGLVQGSDGNFYGTTFMGGSADMGTVFEMTPAGVLTTLFDFADDSVDAYPRAELMFASDGNLYGTASGQDSGGSGSVFRLVYPGAPQNKLWMEGKRLGFPFLPRSTHAGRPPRSPSSTVGARLGAPIPRIPSRCIRRH